jgi:hypothetical protein
MFVADGIYYIVIRSETPVITRVLQVSMNQLPRSGRASDNPS